MYNTFLLKKNSNTTNSFSLFFKITPFFTQIPGRSTRFDPPLQFISKDEEAGLITRDETFIEECDLKILVQGQYEAILSQQRISEKDHERIKEMESDQDGEEQRKIKKVKENGRK